VSACAINRSCPFFIAVFGAFITVMSFYSLLAAAISISTVNKQYEEVYDVDDRYPPLISRPGLHFMGLIAPFAIHKGFLFLWLYLLVAAF
jgi:hypothetical protein